MNTAHKKNRIAVFLIFAMSIIPFAFAWYFVGNPEKLRLGASNGDLISPPVITELTEFDGYDDFSAENIKELRGHWVLINILPEASCGEICLDALHKTQQLILMMGKDIPRVRRLAAIFVKLPITPTPDEWRLDPQLLKIQPLPSLRGKLAGIFGTTIPEGVLLIMDPLGNLMMKYPAGYDPYKVKNDLSKLLRISQIG